jgi:hypothetical protein
MANHHSTSTWAEAYSESKTLGERFMCISYTIQAMFMPLVAIRMSTAFVQPPLLELLNEAMCT